MEAKLQDFHMEHTGSLMVSRQMAFWAANLNMNLKTMDDFAHMIISLDIYKSHKITIFQKEREALGMPPATESDVAMFVDWCCGPGKTELVSQSHIRKYIEDRKLNTILSQSSLVSNKPVPKKNSNVKEELSSANNLDAGLIEGFERVFGRPMYVHEYLKYKDNKLDPGTIFETQQESFRKTRSIMQLYLDEDLGEYEFVKRFMNEADEGTTFYNRLLAQIHGSDVYARLMHRKLHEIYTSMYDEQATSKEISFLFDRVKGLSLETEELTSHVVNFKSERDDIVENIITVFNKTLLRDPDLKEIDHFVLFYRHLISIGNSESLEPINLKLTYQLRDSLEFHDVLKSTIKARYSNGVILTSTLYQVLRHLLENIDDIMPDNMQDKVDAAIGELKKNSDA